MTYLVVDLGLELDSGLDDIDGGEGTVGDGTSESTSKGEPGDTCQWMLQCLLRIVRVNVDANPAFRRLLERKLSLALVVEDSPGVKVNTGRWLGSSGLDGLLGVLDLVVGLVQE